jgi:hypothetical protein
MSRCVAADRSSTVGTAALWKISLNSPPAVADVACKDLLKLYERQFDSKVGSEKAVRQQ